MKLNLNVFNRMLQLRYFKKPEAEVAGYTSKTIDGYHVLFLDYDMVSPDIVYADINLLFAEGLITHAYLFSTFEEEDELGKVGNYHVVCLDKFHYHDIFELMRITHADSLHKELAKKTRYRAWVLRFTGKGERAEPKFLKFFINGFKENEREQSFAHYRLLHTLYEIDDKIFKFNFDNINKLNITLYRSASKLKEEEIKKK